MRNSFNSQNDQLSRRSESIKQNSQQQNTQNEYVDIKDEYVSFSQQRSRSQISIPKSQMSASMISNQYQNDDSVILSSNNNITNKTQTTILNPSKKSQFHISTHSGYQRYEQPAILNKSTNFMPLVNHFSSSELLLNSGIYKKNYDDNDSTKASIMMNMNMSLKDPSQDQSILKQQPLKQQLDIINEEINLEKRKQEFQKHSFHQEQFEQEQVYQRRASEIVEDSIKQLEEERNKPKQKEIFVTFNPYEITRQDRLVKMIENDKKRREYEEQRDAKELNQKKTQQANELLEFLGLKTKTEEDEETPRDQLHNKMAIQPQPLSAYPSESQSQIASIEPSALQTQKSFYQRKKQRKDTTRVIDIINQMNSKTPQEQKLQMIKGEASVIQKSEKNLKSTTRVDFEEDVQKTQRTQKQIRIPTSQTSIQMDVETEKENKSQSGLQKKLSPVESEDEEEDSTSIKHRVEQFVDRRTLKQSFRVPLRYSSAIIKRAFQKQGQTYISKWLSQSTFTQGDLEGEEDIDQTVIRNASVGQQVILLETKPQVIKGKLNKFGKYKRRLKESMTQLDDDEEDPEKIVQTANLVDRKEILKNRMRIQAQVESKKEKDMAKRGRDKRIQLELPESKWEQQQVLLGKRKVRFNIANDLYQPDLDVGPDTIFKNPTFFRGLQVAKGGSQSLLSIGQSATSFTQIDIEQEPINTYDVDQKYNFMSIFSEIYNGGDKKDSKFQKEWREFYMHKEQMRDAFDRMDGLRYRYLPQEKISNDVRNQQVYEDMIKEEEDDGTKWKPDDQIQTNPPDILKEFIIEPNILVYSKNILDLDKNYNKNQKSKQLTVAESRRQAKIGLVDEKISAFKLQNIFDNQDKKGQGQLAQSSERMEGNRQIFDFMYRNPGDLPFVAMKQLQIVVDETDKKKLKLSELEQTLFEQTPMIPTNILTNNKMFLVQEVNEYENMLRKRKKEQENLKSQSKFSSQTDAINQNSETQKQISDNLNKSKAQSQISSMVAAINPINNQFAGNDIKTKVILQGMDQLAATTKQISTNKNIASINKTQMTLKNLNPQSQKPTPLGSQSVFNIQSLQQISIDGGGQTEQQIQENQSINTYAKELQIKTLQEFNDMYTTPQQILSKTAKIINSQKKLGVTGYTDFNQGRTDNVSQSSNQSNPNEGKTVIKNNFYSDYGSYMINTQYDYNIPDYYHQREAEQGLFYLSKHYRDYFEPARDVFAEKDGWDILDQFAKNPRDVNAVKPSIHNYSQQKQEYNEDDILTAFHGLSVMNNHNKLFNDVEQRNEENLRRRIYYNQSQ